MAPGIQTTPRVLGLAFTFLLLCLSAASAVRAQEGNVLFILDGSGSMWGQVEGKHKIVIAKQVMSGLIEELPDNINAGLQIYGHRRKGDCEDIELLSPIGESDKTTLISQIQAINPRGKTPISRSFEIAAERLRHYENETTVVLISDGEETCDADPCQKVRELRDSGIRVQVHVVGFDVRKNEREQLYCIAEAGGGRYFSADSSDQLQQALTEVRQEVVSKAAQPPEPPPPSGIRFVAVDSESQQPLPGPVQWTVIATDSEDVQVLDDEAAELMLDLAPGEYEVFVVSGERTGEARITVERDPSSPYRIPVEPASRDQPFDVPSSVAAGTVLRFDWIGPNAERDLIFIAELEMADNRYLSSGRQHHRTDQGSPAVLTAPARPGTYEIRYYSFNNGTVLARQDLEVTPPGLSLDVPAQAAAGAVLRIEWSGPDSDRDLIFIAEPEMADNRYPSSSRQHHRTDQGSPAVLTAPARPGTYEIRYYSFNNGDVLGREPLRITEAEVELDAPRVVTAGETLQIGWTGPDSDQDLVFIAEPSMGANRYYSSSRHHHRTDRGSPAVLTAPAKPGTYEIRYYSFNNGTTLARRALIVR